MAKVRIMHYMNQFFAGMGGEDEAAVPVGYHEGSIGPGKRLQALLEESVEIAVTAYCGDNYFSTNYDNALKEILQIAREHDVKMLVAGPAFAAGRYGFACTEVCHAISDSLDLYSVAAMYIENPGIVGYRQYKDKKVLILPTSDSVGGMEDALSKIAQFVLKLAAGSVIGPAAEGGYIPRGLRIPEVVSKSGAERAVDMLINKLAGRHFNTEIPIGSLDVIPVTPRMDKLKDALIALVTTAGITPPGNPDGLQAHVSAKWGKYSIENLDSMKDGKWDVYHGGYNIAFMLDNPNYGLPLDACRELEREGLFARLDPYFYSTPGAGAKIGDCQRMGSEMVADMKAEGVNAVLLVST